LIDATYYMRPWMLTPWRDRSVGALRV